MVLLATAIDVSDPNYQKELERSYFSLFLRSAYGKFLEISIFTNFHEFPRKFLKKRNISQRFSGALFFISNQGQASALKVVYTFKIFWAQSFLMIA